MAVVEAADIRGGWRVIAGQKDGVDVVVEATGAKVKDDQVRAVLTVRVGDATAFKSICNLTFQPSRAKVLNALKAKSIAVDDGMLLVLEQACRMPPPRREASATAAGATRTVPLPDLLAEIVAYISRYMVIGKEALIATALWVAHTYVLDAFDVTAYLNVKSPDKRCGKSRFLELLQGLVASPWYVMRPTEAVLFRKIDHDHPTLLIDEVDTVFKEKNGTAEGLRALLDGGNRRGIRVPRCVGDKHEIVEFDTFCARALAGIGSAVPDTVVDRSINIGLVRKKKTEKRARLRARKVPAETAAIRAGLTTWASAETIAVLRDAEPALPEDLDDRAADGWESLLAIADLAGADWPTAARAAALHLHADDADQDDGDGVRLLTAIRDIFDGHNVEERKIDRILTVDLLFNLIEREAEPWAAWWAASLAKDPPETKGPASKLAKMLRPFGVQPKDLRIPAGAKPRKGYERSEFDEAFARYAPPPAEPGTKSHAEPQPEPAAEPEAEPEPEPEAEPEREPEAEPQAEPESKTTVHTASPTSAVATPRQSPIGAGFRAEGVATSEDPVATSHRTETLAAEGLSRCRVVDGGDGGAGEAEGFEEGVI